MHHRSRGDLPLSEYAIIGDGVTAALVADDGSIDWLCHGRFDGPAVFCRLLDAERGGYFQVAPSSDFGVARRYIGSTNVLETELECSSGRARLTDFMPLGSGGGPVILRRMEALSGHMEIRVDFVPTFDFARASTTLEIVSDGCIAHASGQGLRLSSPAPMALASRGATGSLHIRPGDVHWFVLTHGAPPATPADAESSFRATLEAWERWAANGRYPGPYSELLRRSALVLKLLIHAPTGAMVAAPTTSLPESPGGARNWDYRFTWLRDASWVVSALMNLGFHDESMAYIDWLGKLQLGDGAPSVCYDLDGNAPAAEQELTHLRGWRGGRPIRIGNTAARQDQHDVLGEVISAIHMCWEAMPSMRPLEPRLWGLISSLADQAAMRWRQADRGLWEVRDRSRHFLFSRLLCWTALDRALAVAQRDALSGPLVEWRRERDRVRESILCDGFDQSLGAFTRAIGEPDLDASTLLLPRYGLLRADDARMVSTVARVRERLSAGGLVRRYMACDGLRGSEGAFTACSFWLVDCLARQGRVDEAHAAFQNIVAHASDLGLFSEEVDMKSGEQLGNYPQAFTHLALIQAAISIAECEAQIL